MFRRDMYTSLKEAFRRYDYDFFMILGRAVMMVVADLEEKHLRWPDTYFAIVPRDIAGMVRGYVASGWSYRLGWVDERHERGIVSTFYTFGVPHALEHPAEISAFDTSNCWHWYQYGVEERGYLPSSRFIFAKTDLSYHWHDGRTSYSISNHPPEVTRAGPGGHDIDSSLDYECMWEWCRYHDTVPLPDWYENSS